MSLGRDNATWCRPSGSLQSGEWDCVVDGSIDGWRHTRLRTATLAAGRSLDHDLEDSEAVVVPLSGGLGVEVYDGEHVEVFDLVGRSGVFSGPTDVLYVPPGRTLRLVGTAAAEARVAVCLAPTARHGIRSTRHVPAAEVPVELRGAGSASREVRNFGVPGVLDAERIIACEVITPAGNWSSWPPHKHDTERPGVESELEEIYWFETRSTDIRGTDAVGYQRVYGTSRATHRRVGRGAHGRRRPRAPRLARARGRGPGRRPLRPQRHGRPRAGAGLADL